MTLASVLVLLAAAVVANEPETGGSPPPESASGAEVEAEGAEAAPKKEYEVLAEFVTEDSLSPLRYLDTGLVTLNDRCPLRLVRLNRRMEAVYVNSKPVGFC